MACLTGDHSQRSCFLQVLVSHQGVFMCFSLLVILSHTCNLFFSYSVLTLWKMSVLTLWILNLYCGLINPKFPCRDALFSLIGFTMRYNLCSDINHMYLSLIYYKPQDVRVHFYFTHHCTTYSQSISSISEWTQYLLNQKIWLIFIVIEIKGRIINTNLLSLVIFITVYVCFHLSIGGGDWTQGLKHAKHVLRLRVSL